MTDKQKDSELIKEFKKGNQEAYAELVGKYSEKVHNLAMRITRNQEDTEEILQDVFLTVYRKIDSFQGKSAFSSWLYRITVNTSFMKLRKRKQHAAIAIDDIQPGTRDSWMAHRGDSINIDAMCTRHELREALEEAIAKLPEEYKVIFILRDVDGLSNQGSW